MAVVAILAVGVLVGINPIEQINKAKDSTSAKMTSQLFSALQRYYISYGEYPCAPPTCDPSLIRAYNSYSLGLVANSGVNNDGVLVTSGELKSTFRNKAFNDANLFGGLSNSSVVFGLPAKRVGALVACYITESATARGGFSLGESEYNDFVYQKLTGVTANSNYVYIINTPSLEDCDEDSEWQQTTLLHDHFCVLCIYE
jgi:hypothetical protein